MNLVDANVLLYAVNTADPKHRDCRGWLDAALSDGAPVGFAWLALLAFIRLSTRPGIFPRPLTADAALRRVGAWLNQPASVILEPTGRHLDVLTGLLEETGSGGNLTSDAHLAALALEHGATIVTYDRDFERFAGVRTTAPA